MNFFWSSVQLYLNRGWDDQNTNKGNQEDIKLSVCDMQFQLLWQGSWCKKKTNPKATGRDAPACPFWLVTVCNDSCIPQHSTCPHRGRSSNPVLCGCRSCPAGSAGCGWTTVPCLPWGSALCCCSSQKSPSLPPSTRKTVPLAVMTAAHWLSLLMGLLLISDSKRSEPWLVEVRRAGVVVPSISSSSGCLICEIKIKWRGTDEK